jgi:hypothetical protein
MNFALALLQTFRPAPMGPYIMVILGLAVVGFCLWLLFRFIPMEQPIKMIIIAVVVLILIVWLLRSFGMF